MYVVILSGCCSLNLSLDLILTNPRCIAVLNLSTLEIQVVNPSEGESEKKFYNSTLAPMVIKSPIVHRVMNLENSFQSYVHVQHPIYTHGSKYSSIYPPSGIYIFKLRPEHRKAEITTHVSASVPT